MSATNPVGIKAYGVFLPCLRRSGADVHFFGLDGAPASSVKLVAKNLGMDNAQLLPNLYEQVGEAGVAHAPLQLSAALETAQAGQVILPVAFGQDCDVAFFRKDASQRQPQHGLK